MNRKLGRGNIMPVLETSGVIYLAQEVRQTGAITQWQAERKAHLVCGSQPVQGRQAGNCRRHMTSQDLCLRAQRWNRRCGQEDYQARESSYSLELRILIPNEQSFNLSHFLPLFSLRS